MNAILGIKDIQESEDSLHVHFKAKGIDGINCFVITLNASDTYDIQFLKIWGASLPTLKAEREGIYGDVLAEVIERVTSLRLTAPRVFMRSTAPKFARFKEDGDVRA